MHILLNGERRELSGPQTVQALLADLGIDARVVAVELNRTVVRRARHADTIIGDGAEVEIVAFVGGGQSLHEASKHRNEARLRFRLS